MNKTIVFPATPNEVTLIGIVSGEAEFDLLAMGWRKDGKEFFRSRYRNERTKQVLIADYPSVTLLRKHLEDFTAANNAAAGAERFKVIYFTRKKAREFWKKALRG